MVFVFIIEGVLQQSKRKVSRTKIKIPLQIYIQRYKVTYQKVNLLDFLIFYLH